MQETKEIKQNLDVILQVITPCGRYRHMMMIILKLT
jgi:hypothetical protein